MLKGDLYFDSIKLDTAEILIRKDSRDNIIGTYLIKKKTSTQSNHKEEEGISINKKNSNNFFIIKNQFKIQKFYIKTKINH